MTERERKLRIKTENTIRELWQLFDDLSYIHIDCITDDDLDIWSAITEHDAIQLHLERAKHKR